MPGYVFHGSTIPVTTIASLATTIVGADLQIGIQIKAADSNTGIVYVGNSTGVTAGSTTTPLTNGFPLSAGDGVLWPCRSTTECYVISSSTSQQLFWLRQ